MGRLSCPARNQRNSSDSKGSAMQQNNPPMQTVLVYLSNQHNAIIPVNRWHHKNTWYGRMRHKNKMGKATEAYLTSEQSIHKTKILRLKYSLPTTATVGKIKHPLLEWTGLRKYRSTCWTLKRSTEINDNHMLQGTCDFFFTDSWKCQVFSWSCLKHQNIVNLEKANEKSSHIS